MAASNFIRTLPVHDKNSLGHQRQENMKKVAFSQAIVNTEFSKQNSKISKPKSDVLTTQMNSTTLYLQQLARRRRKNGSGFKTGAEKGQLVHHEEEETELPVLDDKTFNETNGKSTSSSQGPVLPAGASLQYYRPVSPKTMDEIMFIQGTQGRQANQRQTAPELLPVPSRSLWRRSRQSIDSDQSESEVNRLSTNSEPPTQTSSGFRRLSIRSASLIEKNKKEEKNPRITNKFLYSLTRMMGKGLGGTERTGSARSSDEKLSLGRSLGVRVMMRREQMMGGQRMAALGTLLAARKRMSLSDHYVLQFDAKIPWRKLRLWVRIRSMLGRLHNQVIDRVVHDPQSPFYMQLNQDDDNMGIDRQHYMFFDPSDFKANRQMRTSQEVIRILTLPAEQRTSEDIHCAMIGLRGISAIAEYPIRMQRYLAEYGTFECYNAKRALVRQGRRPEGFYYILYGKVLIAVRDEVTGRVDVKCYLNRGHSFGEIAIIKNTQRQSSVLTKDYTELLCLSSDIFQKHFMVGGVKNLNDPDQNHFIKSLGFLKGWPMELILEKTDHDNITFGYFKRGSVLAKDSNYSDWLIIVKSGSLTVLKKLVKARPTVSEKTGLPRIKADSNSFLSFIHNGQDYIRHLEQHNIILPQPLDFTDENNNADEDIFDNLSDVDNNEIKRVRRANRPHTTASGSRSKANGFNSLYSASGMSGSTGNIVEFKADTLLLKRNNTEDKLINSSRPKINRGKSMASGLGEDNKLELEDKRTFLDDLDSAYNARAHVTTEADLNPQFVYVQTLTKGDVFGLAQCIFCDQPSMCVVSNGADCLLLSKKLYLDNCSSELLQRLRIEVSPYPCDGKLQEDLVTRINWDVYKNALRKQVHRDCKRKMTK